MEKRSLTNLLLGVVIFGMVAGAGVGIALNYKSVASTVNGWMGDAQKVTFTQVIKKSHYAASYYPDGKPISSAKVATAKDGVFTLDNSEGSTPLYFDGDNGYKGSQSFFENEVHDLNGVAIYYVSVKGLSQKMVGSQFGFYCVSNQSNRSSFSGVTTSVNVWASKSGAYANTSGAFGYYIGDSVKAVAGDVLQLKDFQVVNISGLGVWETAKAVAVFEKLTKGEYFEGDKTFTKGEIKKAISDYEADQKAASTSVASTASASAAASSEAA